MNILVLGSCGREYSILKKLNNNNNKLFCIGDTVNPGIIDLGVTLLVLKNFKKKNITDICLKNKIEMAIIGPEKYLALGIVDYLEDINIKCIGPNKNMARIETDKYYARTLLKTNYLNNFNPKFKHFKTLNINESHKYYNFCKELNFNYVIKATGLNSGKGVKVSGVHFRNDLEGYLYSQEIIKNNQTVLIEEKLIGNEFTLMSYTDGQSTRDMPVVVDYKLLESGNKGDNTGSMGCITYSDHKSPFLNTKDIDTASHINKSIIEILNKDNNSIYKGIIYGSYIKCSNGEIKVIEFNARYGDPECVNVLELLDTNLLDIYKSIIDETLNSINVRYKNTNIISKYLVPKHYPIKYDSSYIIDKNWYSNNKENIIPSSINKIDNILFSTNSRTLVCFGTGNDMNSISEEINHKLLLKNFKYRNDIGFNKNINYKSSGIDIDNANTIVNNMKPFIQQTINSNCIHNQGDYGGIVKIPDNYKHPVLISSIDGVGSKPSFLIKYNSDAYRIAGQDIVAHSINDILVKGADPLFFLDYIASDKLNNSKIIDVIKGMTHMCKQYNCPLVSGETAEMPNIYNKNEIDIAGSITGIAEKNHIIDGKKNIGVNDHVIGLYSNGLHTNGFSLIRKLFKNTIPNQSFIDWVSQPHTCYYNQIKLISHLKINALIHITGGGLIDNPPRVLTDDKCINIYKDNLLNDNFHYIQHHAGISDYEMYRTFNCGIGMMIVMDESNYKKTTEIFKNNKISFCRIGYISKRTENIVNFI